MANNRDRFVKKGLESLTGEKSSYKHFFQNEDGGRLPDNVYRDRVSMLEDSLGEAYESRAKKKLKVKGWQRLATPLRYLAGLNYGIGTALFAALPYTAGFGLTAIGAGVSTLADAIDSHYYHKSGLIKGFSGTDARLAVESVAGKGLGYLPIGTGLIDLYRGRKKFANAAVDALVRDEDVVNYAISHFTDKLYRSGDKQKNARIIPLSAVRDKRYSAPGERRQIAA